MIYHDFLLFFRLGERFVRTHSILKGMQFNSALDSGDFERKDQMSIVFRQQIPFDSDKDCPYAYDGDPVIKSTLRAIFG